MSQYDHLIGKELVNGEWCWDSQRLFPIRVCAMEDVRDWTLYDADSGRDVGKEVRKYHIPDFAQWQDACEFERAYKDLLCDLQK